MDLFKDNGALISECGNYRYKLWRVWNPNKGKILFIMLNPSTADATEDDPTIRRCIGFASDWGYGGLYVGNLYAYRTTDPKMLTYVDDPEGPENRKHITEMIKEVENVVCAWGNGQGAPPRWLRKLAKLHYLDMCKDGSPKHPLYLPKKLEPIGFRV